MKLDLNEDGCEELISIDRWYILNGDNFDIKIYSLKNLAEQKQGHKEITTNADAPTKRY